MTLSRRTVLSAAGVGSALAALPTSAQALTPPGAVSRQQLWSWTNELAHMGPRLTGNAAHRHYVDWLAEHWTRVGLRVHRDRLHFNHWDPHRWSLKVDGKPVGLAHYFPYSGSTPAAGVTAPMVYLGVSPVSNVAWAAAAGKIAVVDVPTPPLPVAATFPQTGIYPSNAAAPPVLSIDIGVSDVATAPMLNLAAAAGVKAVVCIRTGVSDALARDQYSPFTTGYQGCPAVWALPSAGAALRAQAIQGKQATFTLDASMIRGAASETIWAVLPGSDPHHEAVVVNTHSDGPNAAEENGGLGLLALAAEFAKIPRHKRRRSIIFLATTGHFQLPQFTTSTPLAQSSSKWIAMHPEYLNGKRYKAVAALTLEHLGCMEWADNAAHTKYAATGLADVGYCYTSTSTMRSGYLASARGTTNRRTITVLPPPALYFGEGHDFRAAGIATASLIPAPSYLVAAPRDGALGKLNARLMHGQVRTFANLLRYLETRSLQQIGTPLPI